MIYLQSPSTDPRFNLALEQYVFDEMDPSEEYFMLWQNANTIVVGKYQNTAEEVNQQYVDENGITVVRRLSGGGAVYHDMGNLNFTFIRDAGELSELDFGVFCQKIADALRVFGVQAELSGRNDITIDGRKFSGNSQYIKRGRVMHHGTILYDSDLSIIANALNVPKDKFESKGIKSVRSRVANVSDFMQEKAPLADFQRALLKSIIAGGDVTEHILTPEEIARVEEIQHSRYDLWDWNYGFSPAYSLQKRRKIEGVGTLTLNMEVKDGVITAFQASGDYFGNGDPEEFAARMVGLRPEAEALRAGLADVEIGHYFSNLSLEDFVRTVTQ